MDHTLIFQLFFVFLSLQQSVVLFIALLFTSRQDSDSINIIAARAAAVSSSLLR
ncbi:hypothetical protein [Tropheryma whipplei]|uniref:hypothetical protein n=1 Tax=Tropheryma whipplei TaxID=2039 RepID=UPI0004BA693D|nr:hypothetical protein [Tropheryma whipplei]